MREGLIDSISHLSASGITPAYAGRTGSPNMEAIKSEDHPRLCGKDKKKLSLKKRNLGSPPLMREGL